ncbi:MAG TPA: hypothetical protein VGB45_16700 [Abditibacterium sp.]|jgi:hypothetical protein
MKNLSCFFVSFLIAAPLWAAPSTATKPAKTAPAKPAKKSLPLPEKLVVSSAKKGIALASSNSETPKRINGGSASDPLKLRKAPPSKGGMKRRAFMAKLKVDNRTNLFVDLYLDDAFYGTIAPFADLSVEVDQGETKLFAKAQFEDGSFTSWGIEEVELQGGTTWKLAP